MASSSPSPGAPAPSADPSFVSSALGHRDAGRLASAAGGKQRLSGQPGPGDGVGEGI
jgi:hypothetical protein